MITTVIVCLGIVFIAELGDKSQLMALTFALRYRWYLVLGAIAAATGILQGLSVFVGHFLGATFPTRTISALSAVVFLAVGLWTLRDHFRGDTGAASGPPKTSTAAPFVVVFAAVFLSELGDRTMFAAAALAANRPWFGVWLGASLGMFVADALAIGAGIVLGKRLPADAIGIGSGLLYLFFGSVVGIEVLRPQEGMVFAGLLASMVPVVVGAALVATITARRRRERTPTPLDRAATAISRAAH